MNWNKWLLGVLCFSVLSGCKDDDDRDDTVLDVHLLTGKYWFYNAWLGDPYGMTRNDVLQVLRLEKGGVLKTLDYGGRQENSVGKWESEGNTIKLIYSDAEPDIWNVLHSGTDYIQTIVNAQGQRDYYLQPDYLEGLTADAFLVNEYTDGNQFRTYWGASVRGSDIREAALITSEGKYSTLELHGNYGCEKSPSQGDYFIFDGQSREVRFYLRIGKNIQLKLADFIFTENLPERLPSEVALAATAQDGALVVTWEPYVRQDVYYKIEVLGKDMDLTKPYFISRIQPGLINRIDVKTITAGEINNMGALKAGENYVVRLSAILFEPGVDIVNDEYGYANMQAVSYFTKTFVWE